METLKEIIASIGCDPYVLLQTDPKEELAQLRKNYRILALKYHPDKNKE
jgi:curved DNA-binding protein CbpA